MSPIHVLYELLFWAAVLASSLALAALAVLVSGVIGLLLITFLAKGLPDPCHDYDDQEPDTAGALEDPRPETTMPLETR